METTCEIENCDFEHIAVPSWENQLALIWHAGQYLTVFTAVFDGDNGQNH